MRKIGIQALALLLLAACSLPVVAEPQTMHASSLKQELLKRNEEAGMPFTSREIDEFYAFLTEPKAEARQTPSIDVGFYDSPGPATEGETPLGDRIPLILVHGSGSDVISDGELGRPLNDKERWIHYLAAFNADSAFYEKYKVYRFVYDSRLGIEENGENLVAVIDTINTYPGWESEDLDGKDFVVLAHSMGGLVTRAAANTQFTVGIDAGEYFGDHIIHLPTLGTPHHGSPLAVPAWVYDSVLRGAGITEDEYYFSYILHWAFEPTDGEFDLAWDNYDDAVPLTDMKTYPQLFLPVLKDVGGSWTQHRECLLSPYTLSLNTADIFTNNLMVYAATNPPDGHVNDLLDLMFYYLLGILNEHHLLGYSSNKLAEVIAGDVGEGGAQPYEDNDGLVPAVSSLFDGETVSYLEVFDNSDHLSLLDKQQVINSVKNKLVAVAAFEPCAAGFAECPGD
jgi:pimeloyl-ACP methyl ester carboxylesterase